MTVSVNAQKTGVFDPSNVAITGGTIGGAKVSRMVQQSVLASPWRGVPIGESLWPDDKWTNLVYGTNSRKRYTANRATGFVRLVYANLYGAGDVATTDQMTVRASVEVANGGTRQRVYFNGQVDGRIAPGGILVSDPVPAILAATQNFWVWTYACGQQLPYFNALTQPTNSTWGEGCDAANNTATADKTMAGSVTAANVSHISPIAVVADPSDGLPLVGHYGDSIAAGLGDAASPVAAGRGFLRRAMNNITPFVSLALSGDSYTNPHIVRHGLVQGCTDVIDEMGGNDIKSSPSLATMQARMIAAWQVLGAFGAKVWRTTILPQTTSTDTWATLGNQTVMAWESLRVSLNDWIRDGAPTNSSLSPVAVGTTDALRAGNAGHPLAGYFETADAVESSRNSGKWAVGTIYTADGQGTHPNSTGAALLAATIDTARFG